MEKEHQQIVADDVPVALSNLEGTEHTGALRAVAATLDAFAIEMGELSINQTSLNKDHVIPSF